MDRMRAAVGANRRAREPLPPYPTHPRAVDGPQQPSEPRQSSASRASPKATAIRAALADAEWCRWSSRAIARQLGVCHDYVNRLRRDARINVPRPYLMDTSRIGGVQHGE